MQFRDYLKTLDEARRNPKQNPKIGIVQALEPYKNDPNIYISFTAVDKIGINPNSKFLTPNGIYTYPLKEIFNHILYDTIPFAGNQPYVWILKAKTKVGTFPEMYTQYGVNDYEKDMEGVRNYFRNNKKLKGEAEYNNKDILDLIEDNIDRWTKNTRQKSPIGAMWNVTREFSRNYGKGRNSGSKWNALLRALGYAGFADKLGKGLIHPSEPTQAVFLTRSAFKVIDKILNKRYAVGVTNMDELISAFKSKKIDMFDVIGHLKGNKNATKEIQVSTKELLKDATPKNIEKMFLLFPLSGKYIARSINNILLNGLFSDKILETFLEFRYQDYPLENLKNVATIDIYNDLVENYSINKTIDKNQFSRVFEKWFKGKV